MWKDDGLLAWKIKLENFDASKAFLSIKPRLLILRVGV
jgi:hypothetical protein